MKALICWSACTLLLGTLNAQTPFADSTIKPQSSHELADTSRDAIKDTGAPSKLASDYILGPGDQVSIAVSDLEDEFKPNNVYRVDTNGDVGLPPIAGRVHAAGFTPAQLEDVVNQRLLQRHILKAPAASVNVASFGSQPVSILGAVANPGIRQIEGRKSLFDALSLAGGLRPDAGSTINVVRDINWGKIPLPDAHIDEEGKHSVASVKVKDLLNATNTSANIPVMPDDHISVPRADVVYAVGSVTKPGAFPLNEHDSLSALQVLSMAEGLQKSAAPQKAQILRSVPGSTERIQIAVNVKSVMSGKGSDVQLKPGDILFIPSSTTKVAGMRAIEAAVTIATGMAMYGRF